MAKIHGSRDVQDGTIEGVDIKDGSITNADIASDAAIDQSKISQSSGWITNISLSGGNSTSIDNYTVKVTTPATNSDGAYNVRRVWSTNEGENDAQLYWDDTNDIWKAGIKGSLAKILTLKSSAADGEFYSGTSNPTNSTRINYDGYFYATRVYNAVWNDFADYQPLLEDIYIPGYCYYETGSGIKKCFKRRQRGVVGVCSDTFGISVGQDSNKHQIPMAVSGWVLAHVDKDYKPGTALINDKNGKLTKARWYEKIFFYDRVIGFYARKEKEEWNSLKVNGRVWIKVK